MSSQPLRVAVYAIAKDEAATAPRFLESAADADVIVIADTGSRDATTSLLHAAGAQVHDIRVVPWRFDDARNAALALVPGDVDVCISLDLDEVLIPSWRKALHDAWSRGTTRLRYPFVASRSDDRLPATTFWNDRVHSRHGYRWRMPVHEVLVWCGEGEESIARSSEFQVEHLADHAKSRGQYLPMLERLARDEPHDPRAAHYLGREYFYYRRHAEAIEQLTKQLALPNSTWRPQRAEACRIIAQCCEALERREQALSYFWQAVRECGEQREPWVDLCFALYRRGDFAGGFYAAHQALAIAERSPEYFSEAYAWGALPHDILSVCAWQLGMVAKAQEHGELALALAPDDQRIRQNVEMFRQRDGAPTVAINGSPRPAAASLPAAGCPE